MDIWILTEQEVKKMQRIKLQWFGRWCPFDAVIWTGYIFLIRYTLKSHVPNTVNLWGHVNLNDIWMSAMVNHCQLALTLKMFMKTFDLSKVFLTGSNHGGQSNWWKYVVLSWITFKVYFHEEVLLKYIKFQAIIKLFLMASGFFTTMTTAKIRVNNSFSVCVKI